MPENTNDARAQTQQLLGALEIIDLLREELEEWLDEAQDASKKECLENVVGHIEAIEVSYRKRLAELREQANS